MTNHQAALPLQGLRVLDFSKAGRNFKSLALPLRIGGERPPLRRPPPRLGEDTTEVLRELGYGDEQIWGWDQDGVVAT